MLSSISPLGQRADGLSWWRAATAHLLGSACAGAAAGAALGGLAALTGPVTGSTRALLVAGLAVVALTCAALDSTGRVPGIRRQVDEGWLVTYRDWVYGLGYGLQLGLGVVTIVSSASVYLTAVLAAATGSPLWGAVVGAGFGAARASMLWLVRGVRTPADLHRRMAAVDRMSGSARRAAIAGQCLAAAGLAGWAAVAR